VREEDSNFLVNEIAIVVTKIEYDFHSHDPSVNLLYKKDSVRSQFIYLMGASFELFLRIK
jgi:hypothetical protein